MTMNAEKLTINAENIGQSNINVIKSVKMFLPTSKKEELNSTACIYF